MNNQKRNRQIYKIYKAHPDWTLQDIGDLVGLSKQRIQQIILDFERRGIMEEMEPKKNHRLNGEPISATQLSSETGIPRWTIEKWVQRGQVKILEHPGHTAPGKPVFLDPASLQERVDRYRPRPRQDRISV